MKITKGRLKEIIKEELGRVNEDDLDLWSDDEPQSGANSQLPQELIQSWTQEIHKFIASQWSADSDFSSVRAEKPAIIAALKKVANDMWNDEGPEPYSEGRRGQKK